MTRTCHRDDHLAYCDLLAAEGERFLSAVTGTDPEQIVPVCPEWSLSDLTEHVGGLYRWVEAHVRTLSPRRIRAKELELEVPAGFEALQQWVQQGLTSLLAALRSADPEAPVWSWGSDKHVRFWPRRMLFETAVHRADAEITLDRPVAIDQSVAVDGIDELLDNLPHAAYFAPKVEELHGGGETIALRATDANVDWTIRLLQDRFEWDHTRPPDATVDVAAAASDLLLFVYGRFAADDARLHVAGDREVLRRWTTSSAL